MFPLAFETFGRRGKAATAFFQRVARRCEDLETCPKWAFYQYHVPKINAMLMLGNYNKVLAVRHKIMADFDNRYAGCDSDDMHIVHID